MKEIKIFFLLLIVICLTACGKNYVGYWCNYQETATIVILLEDNITPAQKANIEKSVNKYENLTSLNFISKDEYARQLGKDAKDLDIYANYFLTFDSLDSIGTYVEEIGKMPGVHEAKQGTAKSNIKIYNIEKKKKYSYTDSDEPNEQDIEHGKYKIKKGVITFTSEDGKTSRMLYIKNDHLCEDAECNRIFAPSNETCSGTN